MKEIKIFLDKNKKTEVIDEIKFDKIVAGETLTKELYIFNTLNYFMNVELEIVGEHINISKTIKEIPPIDIKKLELKFTPPITIMKPIKAKLNIKIDYVMT